ncbi:MAG: radical SAM protein [Desulfuromonadaceae bacterium]|nr:radical SAM protein [Desulfuromonadaceae bacterium]
MKFATVAEFNSRISKIDNAYNKGEIRLSYPPRVIRIEPTNICNLKCTCCPNAVSKPEASGVMEFDLYKRIIDEVGTYPSFTTVVLYLGGEPLIHLNIVDMIEYATKLDLYVRFNTNATLMNQEIADKLLKTDLEMITFSFDDMAPEEYEAFRVNSKYEVTLKNIKYFLERKKSLGLNTPRVHLASLRLMNNDATLQRSFSPAFLELFEGHQVDFTGSYVHSWAGGGEIVDGKLEMSSTAEKSDYKHIRRKKTPKCKNPWTDIVINYRGQVVTCCYDLQYKNILGDVTKTSVAEVWNNKKFQELRRLISKKQYDKLPLCATCASLKGENEFSLDQVSNQ